MTIEKERVAEAIYAAIDELNQTRIPGERIEPADTTVLLGPESPMNSLDVVNFIVSSEMYIEEKLGVTIELADDQGLWQEPSPFRTVGTLVDYVSQRVKAAQHA